MLISPAQLASLSPDCDAEVLAPALSSAAAEYHIDTPLRLAHWLAQLHVESGGFRRMVENLDYSARRLCEVWPSRFPSLIVAQNYARNPAALAERVYSGRLGNTHPGDGHRFLGRGLIQITGRDNYDVFGRLIGVDLLTHPERAAEPVIAARIAAAFWATHGLNTKADANDIAGITRAINGGLTGLPARQAAVAKAKRVFGLRAA